MVLRQWSYRATVIMDFYKAAREAQFPEIIRPERNIHIVETVDDLAEAKDALSRATRIAYDIETCGGVIDCISFAPSAALSYVIPFARTVKKKLIGPYWPHAWQEVRAWRTVQAIFDLPNIEFTAQNGAYDNYWLLRKVGIRPTQHHDTMILAHARYPELPKGLGFLGSIYTNEAAWKLMRTEEKRDA